MRDRTSKRIVLGLLTAAMVIPATTSLADEAKLDEAIAKARSWKFGDGTGELKYISDEVVKAGRDAAARGKIERKLCDALPKATTRGGKDFLCRQLVLVGTGRSVPALAKLLADKEASHMARYALERIPGASVEAALRRALPTVDDPLRVGIIHSLGRRADSRAVELIVPLLGSSSEDVVAASLVALSRMDSPKAVAAVAKARASAPPKLRVTATAAYLDCAKRLAAAGRGAEAMAICTKLYQPNEPTMCRIAALKGMIAAGGEKAASYAIAAMSDKDPKVREAAIPTLRLVPGRAVTRAVAAELTRQGDDVKPVLLSVLADRGDAGALPAVIAAAKSDVPLVRIAAYDAVGRLGASSSARMLAEWAAAEADRAAQSAARASLDKMQADGTDAAIAAAIRSTKPAVRVELVRSLGARRATGSIAAVFGAAADDDAAVRTGALRTLKLLAGAEHVPALVRLLVGVTDDRQRTDAEGAIVAAAQKIAPPADPAAAVLAQMNRPHSPAVKASLIRVLGHLGHAGSLTCLYAAAKDADADVKGAGIRALAGWPTAAPIDVLHGVATDPAAAKADRIIAMQGYINMIHKRGGATDEQILAAYAKAITLADRTQEKQLVLSKLSALRNRTALEIATRYQNDPALKAAATAAVKKIEQLLSAPAKVTASHKPEAAGNAIDGNPGTRWDTGAAMRGGEWFKLDLGETMAVSAIILDCRGSNGDFPRGWEVYVSTSSIGEGKLAAKGEGKDPVVEIKFPKPIIGKTIKIVQTGRTSGLFWSIHELTIKSRPVLR